MMPDGAAVPRPGLCRSTTTFLKQRLSCVFRACCVRPGEDRSWHVIAALPGSGKSLGLLICSTRVSPTKTKGDHTLPLLAIRAPKNGGKDLTLGMAFCAAFGIVPDDALVCAPGLAHSGAG